jgi:hypothetical protein
MACRESAQKMAQKAFKSHKFHCNTMICHFWRGSTASANHFRYSRGFGPKPALFFDSFLMSLCIDRRLEFRI